MPRKKGAKPIAKMRCPTEGCTEVVGIYQNVRGYLYTRCSHCGADQRNGAEAQVFFWRHAQVIDGVPVDSIKRPRNLPDDVGAIGSGTDTAPVSETVPAPATPAVAPVSAPTPESRPEPVPETVHEPIGTARPRARGAGGVVMVLGVALLGIFAAAAAGTQG